MQVLRLLVYDFYCLSEFSYKAVIYKLIKNYSRASKEKNLKHWVPINTRVPNTTFGRSKNPALSQPDKPFSKKILGAWSLM